jgi:TolB-like protein/Flp pilus assembly protein TadD
MIGQRLSRYEITGKLGEGGMGEVYRARDTELGRDVALKLLPPEVAGDPSRLERFRREAKAIAALSHPNIVTIYNIEESDGTHFLTMELVDGESLDKMLPPGGLPLAKLFDIAIPLADALAGAHEKGIIHRDLKPANVMVTRDGLVKVLDFGLAKLAASLSGEGEEIDVAATRTALTSEGMLMGTAPYMSPEQLEGQPVDHRTDIFALGVVLYEMANGSRPFRGDTSAAVVSSILRDDPPALSEVKANLPRHLGRVVQHCLEKDPRNRYQSALDVRNELKGLRREIDSGAVQTDLSGAIPASEARAGKARSRAPVYAAVAAGIVALVAAGWWLGKGTGREAPGSKANAVRSTAAAEAEAPPSVAVLPFANLSSDADNEYFTDGLTEELIQSLAQVEGLQIPARTSVFALKGSNLSVQEIGARLGVENVLEGSVRKSGNRLRISAQLIEVASGFQLWSDTYDRELEDVFAIQDEIAENIAGALQLTLTPGDSQALQTDRTTNIKAYDYYLRGRGYFRRRTREDFISAREMFSKAIEVDRDYAPAYAGLADSYTEFWRNYESTDENLRMADEHSSRAVELGPESAEAHAARGYALGQLRRFDEAEREFERAIALGPHLFEAYYYYGTVAFTRGDLEKAAEMFEAASRSAPDDIRALQLLPQIYRSLGQPKAVRSTSERRLALAEKLLELDPDDVQVLLYGANALASLGERKRSLEWAERVLKGESTDALVLYNIACFYAVANEPEQALEALEKSYEAGLADPEWMAQDSDLDNIRDLPRYKALVARMESGA